MHIPLTTLEDAPAVLAEADRVMSVCNACRYCEGVCATFQAMTQTTSFVTADLQYLANLCHNCTACYHDCQYAPPHEFDLNVPATLAQVRVASYAEFAWPGAFAGAFARNGLAVSLTVSLVWVLVVVAGSLFIDPTVLTSAHTGPGSFYAVVDHSVMIAAGGATFGFAVLALFVGMIRCWRSLPMRDHASLKLASVVDGVGAAITLKHLDGGHGEGCSVDENSHSNRRRWFHHCAMWGFLFCFAATCVATLYDYAFGWIAPYSYTSLPVLLGTVGGLGLVIGPLGLWWERMRRAQETVAQAGMDSVFGMLLVLVSFSGLVLLAVRDTSAMGVVLLLHLGLVFGFFVALPYSKFVHGLYRLIALIHFSR